MSDAINIVFYIFNKFIDLLFNKIEIVSGVYLGWVILVVIIFSIVFNTLLNIPTGLFNKAIRDKETADFRRELRAKWRD